MSLASVGPSGASLGSAGKINQLIVNTYQYLLSNWYLLVVCISNICTQYSLLFFIIVWWRSFPPNVLCLTQLEMISKEWGQRQQQQKNNEKTEKSDSDPYLLTIAVAQFIWSAKISNVAKLFISTTLLFFSALYELSYSNGEKIWDRIWFLCLFIIILLLLLSLTLLIVINQTCVTHPSYDDTTSIHPLIIW